MGLAVAVCAVLSMRHVKVCAAELPLHRNA